HELSESVIHHHRRSARYNCRYASRAGTGYSRRGSYPDNLWYGLDERTYSARGHLLRSDVWWVQKFNPDQYSRCRLGYRSNLRRLSYDQERSIRPAIDAA